MWGSTATNGGMGVQTVSKSKGGRGLFAPFPHTVEHLNKTLAYFLIVF